MSLVTMQTCALGSIGLAGVTATIPTDPKTWEAIAQVPITVALILLAGFCVWSAFRTQDKSRQSLDNLAQALRESAKLSNEGIMKIASELHERPCIRSKDND